MYWATGMVALDFGDHAGRPYICDHHQSTSGRRGVAGSYPKGIHHHGRDRRGRLYLRVAEQWSGSYVSHGSTCIVRTGGEVFISGYEVIPGAKPLNNVRWVLFKRGREGWEAAGQRNGANPRALPVSLLPGLARYFFPTIPP